MFNAGEVNILENGEPTWCDRSFLVEIKPRCDFASVFVDCPINSCDKNDINGHNLNAEFVRVRCNSLEIIEDACSDNVNAVSSEQKAKLKYIANFADITLVPNSVCGLSWADRHRRLFMCKVKANINNNALFNRKTFRSFEENIRLKAPIVDCVNEIGKTGELHILCRQCQTVLHSHANSEFEFGILPDDDWLDVSPSMEYFCGQACGGGHGLDESTGNHFTLLNHHQHPINHTDHAHNHYHDGILGFTTAGMAQSAAKWMPTERKIVFSHSFLMFQKSDSLGTTMDWTCKNGLIICTKCQAQIGITLRSYKTICKLHVGAIEVFNCAKSALSTLPKDYVISRFQSLERYFAWFFLYKSESQSSMKLLIRTYEQAPFILIWLLEPYVIMTSGVLKHQLDCVSNNSEGEHKEGDENCAPKLSETVAEFKHQSFPALKILYKLYDAESAASDPRANGADSSIGIADIPHSCGLKLAEILLQSSHALPPSLRAVGQLFVGYLRLDEHLE